MYIILYIYLTYIQKTEAQAIFLNLFYCLFIVQLKFVHFFTKKQTEVICMQTD